MRSMMHNDLVKNLTERRDEIRDNRSVLAENERWLIDMVLDLIDVAGDHPGVIAVINAKYLQAFERREEAQHGRR